MFIIDVNTFLEFFIHVHTFSFIHLPDLSKQVGISGTNAALDRHPIPHHTGIKGNANSSSMLICVFVYMYDTKIHNKSYTMRMI